MDASLMAFVEKRRRRPQTKPIPRFVPNPVRLSDINRNNEAFVRLRRLAKPTDRDDLATRTWGDRVLEHHAPSASKLVRFLRSGHRRVCVFGIAGTGKSTLPLLLMKNLGYTTWMATPNMAPHEIETLSRDCASKKDIIIADDVDTMPRSMRTALLRGPACTVIFTAIDALSFPEGKKLPSTHLRALTDAELQGVFKKYGLIDCPRIKGMRGNLRAAMVCLEFGVPNQHDLQNKLNPLQSTKAVLDAQVALQTRIDLSCSDYHWNILHKRFFPRNLADAWIFAQIYSDSDIRNDWTDNWQRGRMAVLGGKVSFAPTQSGGGVGGFRKEKKSGAFGSLANEF